MEPDTFLNKVLQDYVEDPEGKKEGAYTKNKTEFISLLKKALKGFELN